MLPVLEAVPALQMTPLVALVLVLRCRGANDDDLEDLADELTQNVPTPAPTKPALDQDASTAAAEQAKKAPGELGSNKQRPDTLNENDFEMRFHAPSIKVQALHDSGNKAWDKTPQITMPASNGKPTQRPTTDGLTEFDPVMSCKISCCRSLKYVKWGYEKCEGGLLHSACDIASKNMGNNASGMQNYFLSSVEHKAAAQMCECEKKTCSHFTHAPTQAPTSPLSIRRAIFRFNKLLRAIRQDPTMAKYYSDALAALDVAVLRPETILPSAFPTENPTAHPTFSPTATPTSVATLVMTRLGIKQGEMSTAAREFSDCFSVSISGASSGVSGLVGLWKLDGIYKRHVRYQLESTTRSRLKLNLVYNGKWLVTDSQYLVSSGKFSQGVFAEQRQPELGEMSQMSVIPSQVTNWVNSVGKSLDIEVRCHPAPNTATPTMSPTSAPKTAASTMPPTPALTMFPKTECTTVASRVCPRLQTQELCYKCMTKMPACESILTNLMLVEYCTKQFAVAHNTSAPTAAPTESWMLPSHAPTNLPTNVAKGARDAAKRAQDFGDALDGPIEAQMKQDEARSLRKENEEERREEKKYGAATVVHAFADEAVATEVALEQVEAELSQQAVNLTTRAPSPAV
jgi:hypothetical protein